MSTRKRSDLHQEARPSPSQSKSDPPKTPKPPTVEQGQSSPSKGDERPQLGQGQGQPSATGSEKLQPTNKRDFSDLERPAKGGKRRVKLKVGPAIQSSTDAFGKQQPAAKQASSQEQMSRPTVQKPLPAVQTTGQTRQPMIQAPQPMAQTRLPMMQTPQGILQAPWPMAHMPQPMAQPMAQAPWPMAQNSLPAANEARYPAPASSAPPVFKKNMSFASLKPQFPDKPPTTFSNTPSATLPPPPTAQTSNSMAGAVGSITPTELPSASEQQRKTLIKLRATQLLVESGLAVSHSTLTLTDLVHAERIVFHLWMRIGQTCTLPTLVINQLGRTELAGYNAGKKHPFETFHPLSYPFHPASMGRTDSIKEEDSEETLFYTATLNTTLEPAATHCHGSQASC
ncbi:hypothetical protein L249_4683 [Ophiocordyceps polyrhachis-furcata BCC 54312]|uniref:Uncharacterized protein n=1 Tax=Ophiocordyceps polyrhachis-furcata BCC 54312 TaxID=1330021 RepID=A0A367L355_9HYPO|nr:hypothetical protein L249_4683 [Ophiocordyceps polyrhachis-furcata BCC 54312]